MPSRLPARFPKLRGNERAAEGACSWPGEGWRADPAGAWVEDAPTFTSHEAVGAKVLFSSTQFANSTAHNSGIGKKDLKSGVMSFECQLNGQTSPSYASERCFPIFSVIAQSPTRRGICVHNKHLAVVTVHSKEFHLAG